MSVQSGHFSGGFCIPHLDGPILAACEDPPIIGRKGRRANSPAVPLKREQFLATNDFPEFGCLIRIRSDNSLSVPGERYGINLETMPPQRNQFLSACCVPNFSGVIPASRDNSLAVARKSDPHDHVAMPFELEQLATALRIAKPGKIPAAAE